MSRKELINRWIELFEIECLTIFNKKQLKLIKKEFKPLSKKEIKREVEYIESLLN